MFFCTYGLTKQGICNIIHCMNNNYSPPEVYRKRWITPYIREAINDHSIVVLTGARQVGKSTLLLNAEPFCNWRFYTMDDFDVLRQANQDPEALWAGTNQIVLDEVQKAPDLLPAVKKTVDQNPGKYRFILSGSANLLLMKQISESLAGRAVYFVLDPMTLGEVAQRSKPDILRQVLSGEWLEESSLSTPPPDPVSLILRGLMPALLSLSSPQSWIRWWEGYVTTYLERDLRQISQVDALLDFRRLMELSALRSGQLLNQSEIARDARISQPTVHRYLNILETTHLFERLPAFLSSHTTRLLKSPKVFWNDSGLAVFLSGYYDVESLKAAREYGAYFETLIYHHLRVLTQMMIPSGRMYFWRRRDGVEVDFVIEHGRRVLAVEVKRTRKLSFRDISGLQTFLEQTPEAVGGLVVYSGDEIRRMRRNILAVPWTMITG
jgi:predicted AAA+ superfamily ATPase